MPSTIKRDGIVGRLVVAIAKRGGTMTSDHRGFPPASAFAPLKRRDLATMERVPSGPRMRYTRWSLTDAGWDASGVARPEPTTDHDA